MCAAEVYITTKLPNSHGFLSSNTYIEVNIFTDTAHKDITASTLPSLYTAAAVMTLEGSVSERGERIYRQIVLQDNITNRRFFFQCQRLFWQKANNRNSL